MLTREICREGGGGGGGGVDVCQAEKAVVCSGEEGTRLSCILRQIIWKAECDQYGATKICNESELLVEAP